MAKCPYDGLECEKLTERFEKWRRTVNFMSGNQTKLVFVTGLTMLNKCNDVANCSISQGVNFAIAGFIIPNTINISNKIKNFPVRQTSNHSFLENAINCFIFSPPPKINPLNLVLSFLFFVLEFYVIPTLWKFNFLKIHFCWNFIVLHIKTSYIFKIKNTVYSMGRIYPCCHPFS